MQIETIDEFAKVRADFNGGEIAPLLFKQGERTFRVNRVNAGWVERDGDRTRHCFSVEAEGATYFLSLNLPEMTWRVEKVILDG